MALISVWEEFSLNSIFIYRLELLVADCLRVININFCLSLMFICLLLAFKKSSKKKETAIEKEIAEMFKYASDRRKKAEM